MTSTTQPELVSFARGVVATLALWPALRIAVDAGWGGPESSQKRTWLASIIVDAFEYANDKNEAVPDVTYVEEMLVQVLADEFDLVLEDGSSQPIAKSIVQIWQDLMVEGRSDAIANIEGLVEQSRGTKVVADEKAASDEDCQWDEEEESESDSDSENSDEVVPPLLDRSHNKTREEPEIDEDGFTMVKGRGKSHR